MSERIEKINHEGIIAVVSDDDIVAVTEDGTYDITKKPPQPLIGICYLPCDAAWLKARVGKKIRIGQFVEVVDDKGP